ncbi:hypothetical protein LCI18_014038 [Fusarium solani-melongenae]|uniref:Uncharacterized protein n=1 Tax=Fusarium solani subsp. cucurbitae TaxID=2747967 RepID=A0ACD3ZP40_FUSSC|nr:hypothetical protein LCI18_014038 [Fusarium solani-melongenae]
MFSITVYRGTLGGKVQEAHQVTVRVTHSGLCGTDEHYKSPDMVLGYEGVGIVKAIGDSVKLSSGDRVSWGCCHGSCLHCESCNQGQELYREQRQSYGFDEFDQGSFATHATWNEHFLFRIPESIPSAEAAPLMCAGAAGYSALRSAGVQSHHRVGVLYLGGLGHLAVQYAAKMGCYVTVYSRSSSKDEAARKLGASGFQVMGSDHVPGRAVDCLLLAGAQQPDWWSHQYYECRFIRATMSIRGDSDERYPDPRKSACRTKRPTRDAQLFGAPQDKPNHRDLFI